ncbi:Cas10/Cmr2 second palm domain-containing protein [Picosynechococcus sp. NKBG15041c]|uniref:Cas10/Cmr2 second palm domain-containing protein n=1 Tax=Picosynechococcus sp. NKBG15041c TaxID=1407650 RepID=UPI00040C4A9D|nr:hypothetical protein [Picosynechococcus sp. NKBG15041c]
MTNYYLVLIETSGNQNFIFSTNKLKENIGASELTYQAGTFWVGWAVDQVSEQTNFKKCASSTEFREALKQQSRLEDTPNQVAEILVGTSGKALILTRSEETAKKIISTVTQRALIQAPGLDIAGVYVKVEDWNSSNTLHRAVKEVHKKYEKVRSRRPSPLNRFLRLPIIADCAVSELPASCLGKTSENEFIRISKVSSEKRQISLKAMSRLQAIAKDHKLFQDLNKLEKQFDELSWIAIVHADGNGLGQIFLNFQEYISKQDNRTYADEFRNFSIALDECTEAAFCEALKVLPREKGALPIVPLIVGGDDLTVVCHGHYALEFTRVFLQEFEKETAEKSEITAIAEKAFGVGKLSACAGIAIIKPHFPFSVAYDLAEKLIKSAKEVKKKVVCISTKENHIPVNTPFPCSAIDFHILYDTSGIDLSAIQEKLKPEEKTLLYNRPYIVTNPEEDLINLPDPSEGDTGIRWIEQRRWEVLEKWVNLVEELPSSQSHALRTALFLGKDTAEAQCKLIENRHPSFQEFLQKHSLFFPQKIKDKQENIQNFQVTSFLDALNVMDFLKPNKNQNSGDNE